MEGPLNNLKQSMVQFQKPKKVPSFPLILYNTGRKELKIVNCVIVNELCGSFDVDVQ